MGAGTFGAGRRLRRIAVALVRDGDGGSAARRPASYNQWGQDFAAFLDERSRYAGGSVNDTRQRLVKARRMIRRRIREGHLFTFPDAGLAAGEPAPSTNNPIESWNARPRDTPRRHRGPRLTRQLKAICRWRRQHTERPEADARAAENAITGQQLEGPYRQAWERSPQDMHETSGIPHAARHRHRPERLPHTRRTAAKRLNHQTHISAYNPAQRDRGRFIAEHVVEPCS